MCLWTLDILTIFVLFVRQFKTLLWLFSLFTQISHSSCCVTRIPYDWATKTVQVILFHNKYNFCAYWVLVFPSSAYKEQRRHKQVWGMAWGAGDGRLRTSEAGMIQALDVTADHQLFIFCCVLQTFLYTEYFVAWAEKAYFLFIKISQNARWCHERWAATKLRPAGKCSIDLCAFLLQFGCHPIDGWGFLLERVGRGCAD